MQQQQYPQHLLVTAEVPQQQGVVTVTLTCRYSRSVWETHVPPLKFEVHVHVHGTCTCRICENEFHAYYISKNLERMFLYFQEVPSTHWHDLKSEKGKEKTQT